MPPVTLRPYGRRPRAPRVSLSPDLLADLADWQRHLYDRSFIRVSVDMLLHDLRRTVPSTLAYRLAIVSAPGLPEVSITVAERCLTPDQLRSSLAFELPVAHGITADVTFYASRTDAFGELAALLADSSTFSAGQVLLAGPPESDIEPGVHGLADHTRVNFAIGILIGRGRTLDEARHHLRGLADELGSLPAAAEHLLSTFDA